MKIITSRDEIPENMSESEVAEFWATHTMGEELLEASVIEDDQELPKKKSVPISIRIVINPKSFGMNHLRFGFLLRCSQQFDMMCDVHGD